MIISILYFEKGFVKTKLTLIGFARLRLKETKFHKMLELERLLTDHPILSTTKKYAENRFGGPGDYVF